MSKKTLVLYDFLLGLQGGGQRVCVHMAEALQSDFDVSILTKECKGKEGLRWLEFKFGVDLSKVTLVEEVDECDVFINAEFAYWMVDPSPGKIKIIVAHDAHALGMTPNYLPKYDALFVNSEFSATVFKREGWPLEPIVMYPPAYRKQEVDWEAKQNSVLSVGRFDHRRECNSFPTTIDCIKKAVDGNTKLKDWRFSFVGWVVDPPIFHSLRRQATGYPIDFYTNQSDFQLHQLYAQAKYLINLRGIDADPNVPPRFTSHEALGLVTIEAISHGVIPFVYDMGGHRETVPLEALRASTPEEIVGKLVEIPSHEEATILRRSSLLRQDAIAKFSFDGFRERFMTQLEEIRSKK